ncbi:sigma-70 family RNA polymerase sigma factor [Aureibacillus halotolerans]|uniref:Uncharacterized protein n=1 Tax=Aureibacillus halotolerans TaxID=1508390 RepID=A0A4R6TYH6_9BACI|nr:sigma-70 family RNA polymerase sigma factor [Aureibacillus halotolerans]TDQ35265.1 hypothetical protein EV213_12252 [Aureibacillus halotolerans]
MGLRLDIEMSIRSYSFYKKEIRRLQRSLVYRFPNPHAGLVAQSGIDSVMPQGSPGKSFPELVEMDRKEQRQFERLLRFEELVHAIEKDAELLEKEEDLILYECMMDEMSYREIAIHMGYNRNKIRQMKEEMLSALCQKCQKCQMLHVLTSENSKLYDGREVGAATS